MEDKRSYEELTGILDRTTAWIENCDSKTSILLAGLGVLSGILLATDYAKKFLEIYRYLISHITFWMIIYLVLYVIAMGLIVAGVVSWICVLFARVNINDFADRGIKSDSLIFFSSIAKHKTFSSYKKKLKNCKGLDMEEDLISQIYICSIICDKKFRYYKLGLIFVSLGLALLAVFILIWLLFI